MNRPEVHDVLRHWREVSDPYGAVLVGETYVHDLEALATFYDLLRTSPVARHSILVCHNLACWLRGAEGVLDAFSDASGVDADEVDHIGASSDDGEIYLKSSECLGACDIAPMASIEERYYGPLTPADARDAVKQLRSGADPLPEKALARRGTAGGPEPEPDPRVAEGRSE
jgi:NADH:ubiquinone oxidoreductase subunit E